ncbi:MAG: OmpA family protein [Proteobacteria bacterium]|nr:OmpA family protein [Pseudomonadota bacterium]
MRKVLSLTGTAAILLGLSGCATYSDAINQLAPERTRWQHDDYTVENSDSAFCEKPITELYMVMPEEGKEGTVVVTFNDGREVVLNGDYSAMSYSEAEQKEFLADDSQMEEMFGSAIDVLPNAPIKTELYFLLGKNELTPESLSAAQEVYNNVLNRQSPEVLVIGHTDTLGSIADNQSLSVQRAEVVKDNLIEMGVESNTIKTSGMGEQNLAVETADNTREPKNRRVEINVR